MLDIKRFSGTLNTDDSPYDVIQDQHIDAKNIRFVGGQRGLTAMNIKGNVIIANSNLPSGTNECIGAFFDQVNHIIYFFNYNSNTNHGIYKLTVQTGVVSQVFRCGVNSATDILTFNLNHPVTSVSIVYRTTGDGDLLYWTDGYNRPRFLNLDTVFALTPFTVDMINAGKNAPLAPPTATYRDDAAVTTNALRKKLFRFAQRWWYDSNGGKSTISPISKEPLPIDDDNFNIQNDPTKNNNIRVVMNSGAKDTKAIELLVQESLGTTWGDLRTVAVFDRTEYSISPNSTFTFDFYNNSVYPAVSVDEQDLYFSWLPDKANALELLNGNVLIYGGITDGYEPLARQDVDVTMTVANVNKPSDYGFAYKWSAQYRFGLVYFDERGKTNGVVSFVENAVDTNDFFITTPDYSVSGTTVRIPKISAAINHLPPSWATKYQWVRTPNQTASKFLYFATNDYQSDSDYLYFCIQSLIDQRSENTGFIPSYEFASGDRVRVIAYYDVGTTTFVPYNIQLDFEILGTVEKTMTSPASDGTFLKVFKPSTLPSTPYQLKMLIEIYTPALKLADEQQFFYEFGECYSITGGFHMGQIQNQTALQPATFEWTDGDGYYRERLFITLFLSIDIDGVIMDANYSDFFLSAVSSNGRGWVIDENAREEYNPVLVRWGGQYEAGTNVNNLPLFQEDAFDEVDRSKGDIRRFKTRDRILRVFQDRGVGQYGVYARFIQNNEGNSELVTTNEIITSNNIQYYQGVYGVGGYATNLTSATIADYFLDIVTGRAIRLSSDGLTDLGLLYKGQYYLSDLVTPYNKEILRPNSSIAKVMGFFDYSENQFHSILQGGSVGGTDLLDYNFSFNEIRNAFCSFYDFHPEWALSADGIVYSWKNGGIYRHNSNTYCNFYGVQYHAYITPVFNQNVFEKKTWLSISQTASDKWYSPLIYTDVMSYGTQRQESTLVNAEFTILEGKPSAAFKRDANSRGGKVNGNFLKGSYLAIKLQKENATDLITLSELGVYFADSPLTVK